MRPWAPETFAPYYGTVTGVHDGDTIAGRLDVGFGFDANESIRIYGINAPELRKGEPAGAAARDFLRALLPEGAAIRVTTARHQARTFARYVGTVEALRDGRVVDVAAEMVAAGHATWCDPDLRPLPGPPPPLVAA